MPLTQILSLICETTEKTLRSAQESICAVSDPYSMVASHIWEIGCPELQRGGFLGTCATYPC